MNADQSVPLVVTVCGRLIQNRDDDEDPFGWNKQLDEHAAAEVAWALCSLVVLAVRPHFLQDLCIPSLLVKNQFCF